MNTVLAKKFTGAEMQFLEGAHGKKLADCTDNEIKQLLAYCCIMAGIQRPPANDQKVIIVAFLRKYFGTFTTTRAAQAFELLAKGELGREVQEHYNCISPQYLSGVLRAYMQKFSGVMSRHKARQSALTSTPETYYNRLMEVVGRYNVIPLFWAWNEVYEYLSGLKSEELKVKNEPNAQHSRASGHERRTESEESLSSEKKKQSVIDYLKHKYPGAMLQALDFRAERRRS